MNIYYLGIGIMFLGFLVTLGWSLVARNGVIYISTVASWDSRLRSRYLWFLRPERVLKLSPPAYSVYTLTPPPQIMYFSFFPLSSV